MKRVLLIARAKFDASKEKAEIFAERIRGELGENFQIETAEIGELFFEIDKNSVEIYHPEKGFSLRDFDLVIIRHAGKKWWIHMHAIAAFCEHFGIKYMDSYLNRLLPENKLSTQFALWFAGVKNWPKTFFGNFEEMKRRLPELGEKAILKDNEGAKGRLNFLVESAEEISKIQSENPETEFVLQEFIPNSGDLRVLVLGGKVRLIIGRKGAENSHLNNTSQGGTAEILPLENFPPEILEISKKAAEAAKLEIAGVDVMRDVRNGEIYLLEINNAPQISSGSFVEEKAQKYAEMIREALDE